MTETTAMISRLIAAWDHFTDSQFTALRGWDRSPTIRLRWRMRLGGGPSVPRFDAHATRLPRRLRRHMAEDSSPARPSKLPGSGMAEMLLSVMK